MSLSSMTAIEFQDSFRTEEDCQRYLAKLRWPKGFICPNCEHDDAYLVTTRGLFQCVVCRHQTSVTSGTLFHGTKIPLRNWFWMIYQVSQDKGGASSTRLAEQLGMYQKTVWHILQKIRHAMSRRDENIILAGLIELDEAVIGPQARKTGRRSEAEACKKMRGKSLAAGPKTRERRGKRKQKSS